MKTIRLKSKLSICKTIKLIVKLGLSLLVVGAIEMACADNLAPTPNEQAVVNGLQKPKFNDYDVNGPCQNNRDAFAYMRAYNIWNDPKYKKMFLLWGMHHAGARAVTNDLRCADLQLIAKLWQSAVNSPITGKLKASETAGFAISVNQIEKKNLQQGMASNRTGEAPIYNAPGSGFSSQAAYNASNTTQLDLASLKPGNSIENIVSQLPSILCKVQGNQILCSKEGPCSDYQGTRKRGAEMAKSADEMVGNILKGLAKLDRGIDIGQEQEQQYVAGLAQCRAQHANSPINSASLSYAGNLVLNANLTFQNGRYTNLLLVTSNNFDNGMTKQQFNSENWHIHSDALNRWLSANFGSPKVDIIRTTETWDDGYCTEFGCNSIPRSSYSDHKEYTWQTKQGTIHQHGRKFNFDWSL